MIAWRFTGTLVWLTVLWVLLWHDWSIANVLAGAAVGAAVLVFARLPRFERRPADERSVIRPLAVLRFLAHVVRDLVRANLTVARLVLWPRSDVQPAVIAVPLRSDTELPTLVVIGLINMSPGTVTIDVVGTPPVVFVHVLHVVDAESARRDLLLLEELFVDAFGSREARRQVAREVPA